MTVIHFPSNTTVDSSCFKFTGNTFSAEMSSLGKDFRFDQYNNAPRFYIRSDRTGIVMPFDFILDVRNNENEVLELVFRCSGQGQRHLQARLFND